MTLVPQFGGCGNEAVIFPDNSLDPKETEENVLLENLSPNFEQFSNEGWMFWDILLFRAGFHFTILGRNSNVDQRNEMKQNFFFPQRIWAMWIVMRDGMKYLKKCQKGEL